MISAEPIATTVAEPAADLSALDDNEAPTPGTDKIATTFAELGVPRRLVETLQRGGITAPFPIQAATIPDALAGRDVLGRGQTGSGKTLAFGLPMLARLATPARHARRHPAKALILVPTRELAMQVNDALAPLARTVGLFTKTAVRRRAVRQADPRLRRGVDVLVATPGRLGDLIERGDCSLDDDRDHACSTRPTRWPTWASCPRSPSCWRKTPGARAAAAVLGHARR